ncbi:hypothetical protein Droror1_Dr00026782, partial [Drosera rotundifolia]
MVETPIAPTPVPPSRRERGNTVRSAQPPTDTRRLLRFQEHPNTLHRHSESQVPLVDIYDEVNEAFSYTAMENIALQHEATASRRPALGPFTPVIHDVPFPQGLRMPSFNHYDGTTDPEDHVSTFEIMMQLYNVEDAIMCKAFPSTFAGAA